MVLCAIFQTSYATHLMGGSFTYEYIGKVGTQYSYKLKIQMFRDCYNSTTPFDNSIQVGIYYNNSAKSRLRIENISLTTREYVDPPSGGSNCTFEPNVCIERGYYEKVIYLPYSNVGWYLLHQRCCRNNLTNLATNMGQSYSCFIPPQSKANNSPSFSGIPTPYLCANDTITLSYAAVDVDGDSLAYTLAYPWAGGTANDPAPTPPSFLNLPVITVNYASGYSFSKPFGNSGFVSLNSQTGIVSLSVPLAGLFAFAVDVSEYRNGVLLSTVRRDIELIVLNCPPNAPPKLIIPGNVTTYYVDEGDFLSFDIPYKDKDSMDMYVSGDILDPTSDIGPPYAQLQEVSGIDTIVSTFSWQTACGQGRTNPYFITVKVQDRGCPGKSRIDVFVIKVIKFTGPDSISGPRDVCQFDSFAEYQVHGISDGSLLNWTLNTGNLQSGQGDDTIWVNWNKKGQQMVKAYETSSFGCGPVGIAYLVNVHENPVADGGGDRLICSGDTITLGVTSSDTTLTYHWSPESHISDTAAGQPQFTFRNISDTVAHFTCYLEVSNINNCTSFDTIHISVKPEPDTFSIGGTITPCYNGIFPYNAIHSTSTYQWIIKGGNQVNGGNGKKIKVHWTDTLLGMVSVLETNNFSCTGDTSFLPVTIVNPLPVIHGPAVVCPNTVHVEYKTKADSGSTFYWHVDNGTRTDNDLDNYTYINWPDSGNAMITLVQTTKEGCISDSVFFPVVISYRLETSPISGDTHVCAFSTGEPYHVMNVNGSTYNWWIDGGIIQSGNGKYLITSDWLKEGSGMLKVLETSYDSVNDKICMGDTIYQPVVINPLPKTTPIRGRIDVCEYDTASYAVSGFDSSYFFWSVNDTNILFTGQGTDSITIFWQKKGSYYLSVLELTKDSCTNLLVDTFVVVHPIPTTSGIIGDSTICFPDNSNIKYQVKGYSNSAYNWSITGGEFETPNGKSSIFTKWTSVPSGHIQVQETSFYGCIGPVKSKSIVIDSLTPNMKLVTTLPENDKIIEVDWSLFNDQYYNRKTLLYKDSPKRANWKLVDSFDKFTYQYVDNKVQTGENIYNYKISVKNICSNEFESAVHRSILLNGSKKEFQVSLSWNSYIGWETGVEKYEVFRRINDQAQYTFYRQAALDTHINLSVGIDGRHQCYRIVSTKQGNRALQSWSNEVCFDFEPVLHVPTAFTPNNDGLNDTFFVHAYNMASFRMEIYNRWGERVFATDSPKEGWDGTFKGSESPMDAYIVIIRYMGNTPTHSYKGTVTLIR